MEGPINAYVDDLLGQHGLDPSRCALVGFSQGAIVGLHVALRRRVAVGGLVAFSGLIATSDRLKGELASVELGLLDGDVLRKRYQAFCAQRPDKGAISSQDIFNPIAIELWARSFEGSLRA